jgi:hypothetical protein
VAAGRSSPPITAGLRGASQVWHPTSHPPSGRDRGGGGGGGGGGATSATAARLQRRQRTEDAPPPSPQSSSEQQQQQQQLPIAAVAAAADAAADAEIEAWSTAAAEDEDDGLMLDVAPDRRGSPGAPATTHLTHFTRRRLPAPSARAAVGDALCRRRELTSE